MAFFFLSSFAGAETVQNFNQWFSYSGDHQWGSSRWGAHFDGSVRRNNFVTRQQFLWRPGLNYELNQNVQLQTAFTWLPSYSFGRAPSLPQTERRLWQQAIVSHQTRRLTWSHRGRFEQRWLNSFEQRLRYAWRVTLPSRDGYSYSLGTEVFFPLPPERHPAKVDQHRIQFTLSKQVNEFLRVDTFYFYQNIWQRNGRIREDNHTFGLSFANTASLTRLLRGLR